MSILVVIRLKFFKDFRSLLIKLLSTNYLLQNDWVNVNQSLQIACLGEICQTEGSYLSTMGNNYYVTSTVHVLLYHIIVFNDTFLAKLRGTSQVLLVKNCVIQRTQFEERDLMNCFICFAIYQTCCGVSDVQAYVLLYTIFVCWARNSRLLPPRNKLKNSMTWGSRLLIWFQLLLFSKSNLK